MFYRFMNFPERLINPLNGLVPVPAILAGRGGDQSPRVAQQCLCTTEVFPRLVAFLSSRQSIAGRLGCCKGADN